VQKVTGNYSYIDKEMYNVLYKTLMIDEAGERVKKSPMWKCANLDGICFCFCVTLVSPYKTLTVTLSLVPVLY